MRVRSSDVPVKRSIRCQSHDVDIIEVCGLALGSFQILVRTVKLVPAGFSVHVLGHGTSTLLI